jgi:hypothetical protein
MLLFHITRNRMHVGKASRIFIILIFPPSKEGFTALGRKSLTFAHLFLDKFVLKISGGREDNAKCYWYGVLEYSNMAMESRL